MLLRRVIANTYYFTGRYLNRLNGNVVILTYHRVLSDAELNESYVQPGMYVHKDVFEEHMRFLKSNFVILSFQKLLELWDKKAVEEDKRYCVITFDDGWLDNYTNAYPILKKYELPATIFLVTSFIGTDEWFWPEKIIYLLMQNKKKGHDVLNGYGITSAAIEDIITNCKKLNDAELANLLRDMINNSGGRISWMRMLLNWDEVREMSEFNIHFGSHTKMHKILTNVPISEVRREIAGSLKRLKKEKINHVPVFCYPNGNFTPAIAECVKEEGFMAAVGTSPGVENSRPGDIFGLRRIGIHNDISNTVPLFAYRLSQGGRCQ